MKKVVGVLLIIIASLLALALIMRLPDFVVTFVRLMTFGSDDSGYDLGYQFGYLIGKQIGYLFMVGLVVLGFKFGRRLMRG